MYPVAPILDQYESMLHGNVARILDVAFNSPAGGADRWDGVMKQFELPNSPTKERGRIAAQRQHVRGAFPEEVEQVLGALAFQARQTLDHVWAAHQQALQADPSAMQRLNALAASLPTLAAQQRAAYEQALRPKPATGAGVAGIFANVRATAEINPWNKWRVDERQTTLSCRGCGSAQQTELVFTCKYCGNNLFGDAPTT